MERAQRKELFVPVASGAGGRFCPPRILEPGGGTADGGLDVSQPRVQQVLPLILRSLPPPPPPQGRTRTDTRKPRTEPRCYNARRKRCSQVSDVVNTRAIV